LRQDARNSDRPIFDANGNPATYSQEDVTVQIPLYDEDGNISGYRTEIIGEVGTPKTVGSEYRRGQAEAALFGTVRQERFQARNQATSDRNQENSLKQQALNRRNQSISQKNSALTAKATENERKNARLLEIEAQIAQVRDTAIAEARQEAMGESLAQAEQENQREQDLEDRFGARTPDNPGGIPTTEAEAISATSVPEPSSILGLMAITGACATLRRRRRSV
jgi:flagellar biosynthesis GTPase FlhF